MNKHTEKMKSVLDRLGVNYRRVDVLGTFVHIDTFEKYGDVVKHALTSAGAKLSSEKNGVHMDGLDGYRLVFKF